MRIYVLTDERIALECRQLISLKAECGRLEWSKVIKRIPAEVAKSLSIIDSYVDEKVEEFCSENISEHTVGEKEEEKIFNALKKNNVLRAIVGSGVVLQSEIQTVLEQLDVVDAPILKEALKIGKSIVIV